MKAGGSFIRIGSRSQEGYCDCIGPTAPRHSTSAAPLASPRRCATDATVASPCDHCGRQGLCGYRAVRYPRLYGQSNDVGKFRDDGSNERDLPQSQRGSVAARPRPRYWSVVRQAEPNLPSGGQVADIEIGAFLIGSGHGPEKQELLRLIGTLVCENSRRWCGSYFQKATRHSERNGRVPKAR